MTALTGLEGCARDLGVSLRSRLWVGRTSMRLVIAVFLGIDEVGAKDVIDAKMSPVAMRF